MDLLAIGALFLAVSGWQRLVLDTGQVLPLSSWTAITTNSQRLWAQTLLALLFVRYTLNLDLAVNSALVARCLPAALSQLYRPWSPPGEPYSAETPNTLGWYILAPPPDKDGRDNSPLLVAEEDDPAPFFPLKAPKSPRLKRAQQKNRQ